MSDLLQSTSERPRTRVPWLTDLSIVVGATVSSLVAWLCLAQLAGVDLEVGSGGSVREVGGLAVAVTALLTSLVGVLVLRVLESRGTGGLRTWSVVAVVVTLVSFLGPLGATTGAAKGALLALHTIVATVVIVGAHRSRAAFGAVPQEARTTA